MCTPNAALGGTPGTGVEVLGAHFTAAGFGAGVGGVHGAGVLAFTGVGPGTLPLAIAGIASIAAGAAATVWGRDKQKSKRRRRNNNTNNVLPDLSHLATAASA